MDMKLFDSASGKVVAVEPREPGTFSMYVCGPTVYDYPHLGHGRALLTYDILRRYLESRGIEVHHVSNITDIEDKIIDRAKAEGRSETEVVEEFETEWYRASDALGVLRPHQDPHATAYIEQMVELVQRLIDNGNAYVTDDTVYFASETVDGYGLLARQSLDSLKSGARVETDDQKRSPVDFALWKKAKPNEPIWSAPWFDGRPGWHTECVVMSLDLLGDGFDLHTGGMDLMFPHHENERAQALALGNTFSRHWMHHAFLETGGVKMSKSLGNFTTLTELLEKNDPRAYRLLVLRAHYRTPVEVTPGTLADAEAGLKRLDDFGRRFGRVAATELPEAFTDAMNDDLDTPGAVAVMFSTLREANALADAGDDSAGARAAQVVAMCGAVGLVLDSPDEIDDEAAALVSRRDAARADKDWERADLLRDGLVALGWVVEDSQGGTRIHR